MMEFGLSKVVGADPKIRALEKRFKEATPNLVLNRKGTFDYENRPDGQVINHFENVTFTTKDLLTKSLLKHCGENTKFYPESVLYNDTKGMDAYLSSYLNKNTNSWCVQNSTL